MKPGVSSTDLLWLTRSVNSSLRNRFPGESRQLFGICDLWAHLHWFPSASSPPASVVSHKPWCLLPAPTADFQKPERWRKWAETFGICCRNCRTFLAALTSVTALIMTFICCRSPKSFHTVTWLQRSTRRSAPPDVVVIGSSRVREQKKKSQESL